MPRDRDLSPLKSCSPSCLRACGGERSRTPRGSSTAPRPTSGSRSWDVVLSLAVSDHLYPRFERYGAGRLTKVRAQAVSGPSCARVARSLGCRTSCAKGCARGHRPQRRDAGRLRARARLGLRGDHRRRLPGVRPRADGAGGGRVVPRRDRAGARAPVDYKSVLQERLARRAEVVAYRTVAEEGPAHDRSFIAVAEVAGEELGRGERKDEEGRGAGGGPARGRARRGGGRIMHLRSISMKGFKSFPNRTKLEFGPGVSVVVGRTARASRTSPTRCCGRSASSRRWRCAGSR